MKVVLQRVKKASVSVEDKKIAEIAKGFLIFVGIDKRDTIRSIEDMAKKIGKIRVFEDKGGKMNLDIGEAGGKILSVSQFTLNARTDKGNRPGFGDAQEPEKAKDLWLKFNDLLSTQGINVEEGAFGEHMDIEILNDGPVTFVFENNTLGEE